MFWVVQSGWGLERAGEAPDVGGPRVPSKGEKLLAAMG